MVSCNDVLHAYLSCNGTDPTNCTVKQAADYQTYWRLTAECLNNEFDEKLFTKALQLFRIEFYVSVTAILVCILAVFGATRRRRDSILVKFPVFLAYGFSSKLVYYSLGLMQAISFYNEPFTFWAAFLLIVLAKADSMTAFSLDDNEGKRRFLSDAVLQFLLVTYLIVNSYYVEHIKYFWVLCLLVIWGLLKAYSTAIAMKSASLSSGLARSSKLAFEFMRYEHDPSEHNMDTPNLQTMARYNYLVAGEDEFIIKQKPKSYVKEEPMMHKVVTLQKVWKCEGRLITCSKSGSRCKDLCLSYALFRLICCKFGGYSFPISTREKSWNLVRNELISDSEEGNCDDHERVFRVIEVELAFLYDFFYTKYPHITGKGYLALRLLELVFVGLGCWAAVVNCKDLFPLDIGVTVIVIASMVLVQLVQLFYIITSDWLKVKLICRYVQKMSWWIEKKMLMAICYMQWKPWAREVKQYSLIESFQYTPSPIIYNCCVTLAIDKPRKGQKKSKEIRLSEGVKRAIVASLKLNGPKLSNGEASLHRNGFGDQLGWACKLETTTHVVLVWHIATSLCEIELSTVANRRNNLRNSEQFLVANSLSKYCAYLVAFQPKLLPDHHCVIESIFDGLVKEARKSLKKCKTKFDKHGKMMELAGRQEHRQNSILEMGAQLGLSLEKGIRNGDVRWKVLSDFWAELVLFLAPSEELKSHAEQLASGGELLTHLMALLFHAGVVDRDSTIDHDL